MLDIILMCIIGLQLLGLLVFRWFPKRKMMKYDGTIRVVGEDRSSVTFRVHVDRGATSVMKSKEIRLKVVK